MVNWEFFDNQTPTSTRTLVDDLRSGADVRPTRGPDRVCTFKQMSRTLAGFADGLADQGVGAGGPSVVGLKLARAKGWQAPGDKASGGTVPVEQIAADHVASPSSPSANDAAAAAGTGGAASTTLAGKTTSSNAPNSAEAKRSPRQQPIDGASNSEV